MTRLLLVLLAGLAFGQETISNRTFELARQLRCPVCTSESVADSNAEISVQMREQIERFLREGRSDAEILAHFQERYGDWILLEPPRRGVHLLVWLLPFAAAGAGVLLVVLLARSWLSRARTDPDLSDEERARVRRAMDGEG